ncbi:MAG: SDR family oxidoreductase [bacterium]|nr:SDR family oxidoreductase [bacterium]
MSRLAVITGSSRGLGLALADQLARRGWKLVLTGRHAGALEKAGARLSGWTQVTTVAGDVADASHRERLATTVQALGPLHALVNNAAILGPSPRPALLDLDWHDLERILRINTMAPLAVLQALAPSLVPGGCILNVSSDAAPEAYAGWGGYGLSKAALDHLSATLALEHPEWRVYAVDPGDMLTDMYRESFPGEDLWLPGPEANAPALVRLIEGNRPSGRYLALDLLTESP